MVSARAACVVVLLSICLLAVLGKHHTKDGSHNISRGQRLRRPYPYQSDVLIFHDTQTEPPKTVFGVIVPFGKQKKDVCYPANNSHPKFSITAFNVTDLMPRGDGGYAFIDKGGVGSSKLCLHLKSQARKGYNFTIDIWGYYKDII